MKTNPERPEERDTTLVRRVATVVPPQYVLLGLFGSLLLVLRLVYPQPLHGGPMSVRYALYMMGVFVVASIISQSRQLAGADSMSRRRGLTHAIRMIGDWLPFVVCLWVYENLHDLTRWIRPDTVDAALSRIDVFLFGVQPTLWLQHWIHPLLTDYLALAYMTYFVFPPLLSGWLYFQGKVDNFKELQLSLLIAFYMGFLGYVLVPAVGPQLILASRYRTPLVGRYFFWGTKQLVLKLQSFPRDCFPSLHTAISSVTQFYFFRTRSSIPARRLVLTITSIITVSLWVATVYLRYHWVIDVVAGWAVAAIACALGIQLHGRWPARRRIDRFDRTGDHREEQNIELKK